MDSPDRWLANIRLLQRSVKSGAYLTSSNGPLGVGLRVGRECLKLSRACDKSAKCDQAPRPPAVRTATCRHPALGHISTLGVKLPAGCSHVI